MSLFDPCRSGLAKRAGRWSLMAAALGCPLAAGSDSDAPQVVRAVYPVNTDHETVKPVEPVKPVTWVTPVETVQPSAMKPAKPRHRPAGSCRECRGACGGRGCAAHCPVKPDEFGFYETQWRSWPRPAVTGAVNAAEATPVSPPASEVPSIDEELPPRSTEVEETMEEPAAPLPAPQIPFPDRGPPAAKPMPPSGGGMARPRDVIPSEEPSEETPPAKTPAKPTPKKSPPADDNLFDEARRLPRAALLATLSRRAAQERSDAAADANGLILVGYEEPAKPVAPPAAVRPDPVRTAPAANPLRATNPSVPLNPLR